MIPGPGNDDPDHWLTRWQTRLSTARLISDADWQRQGPSDPAGATVTQGIDVFLDARNLTGKKAIGDVSAVLLATPSSAIYYPVERRAVYGGVRARF